MTRPRVWKDADAGAAWALALHKSDKAGTSAAAATKISSLRIIASLEDHDRKRVEREEVNIAGGRVVNRSIT
jgi:hypothetical protein